MYKKAQYIIKSSLNFKFRDFYILNFECGNYGQQESFWVTIFK